MTDRSCEETRKETRQKRRSCVRGMLSFGSDGPSGRGCNAAGGPCQAARSFVYECRTAHGLPVRSLTLTKRRAALDNKFSFKEEQRGDQLRALTAVSMDRHGQTKEPQRNVAAPPRCPAPAAQ